MTTAIFKFNPLGYHLFALILRFLSVVLFYKILKEIWSKKPDFAFFAASIFAVYPGFLQQPIALIYCHHFSVLNIFLLSLWLMIKAVKAGRINFLTYGLSVLGSLQMFSIENFATLELIRPFLLWMILDKNGSYKKYSLKKTFLLWLPYLIIFISFLIWRVLIFKFPTYQPDLLGNLIQSPNQSLPALISRIPKDFFTVTYGAWSKSFSIPQVSNFGKSATLLFWILTFFSLVISYFFASNFAKENTTGISDQNTKYLIPLAGIILFLLAGSIVWVLGLPLEIKFAWDRMTLAFIPAVAILAGALLNIFQKYRKIQYCLFAVLISLAVGSHFENGMSYKRDWENLQEMFWQLSWRIPNLQENTTLITSETGLNYYSDNSLTSPINMMYSDQKSKNLEYFLYFTDVRLGLGLKQLEKDIPINQKYRSFSFSGNTSRIIAFKNDPPDCLQIMDRTFSNSITNPNLTQLQTDELRMTNLSLIQADILKTPPAFLFGSEPDKNWCNYFEKADLARQNKDYELITNLGEEAISQGFHPRSASEWLPFLEGYLKQELWDRVDFIATEFADSEGNNLQGMCYIFHRIENDKQFPSKTKIQEYLKRYNCL